MARSNKGFSGSGIVINNTTRKSKGNKSSNKSSNAGFTFDVFNSTSIKKREDPDSKRLKKGERKAKGNSLDDIRRLMKADYALAMARLSNLQNDHQVSAAIEDAIRSLSPKRREAFEKGEIGLFDIKNLHSYRELRRESQRIQQFLSDPSSRKEVAGYEEKQLLANAEFMGAFGSNPDYNRVDEELAKAAFRAYRMVESSGGAAKIYGEGGYGSDNVINYIYRSIVENSSNDYTMNELSELSALEMLNILDDYDYKRRKDAEFDRISGDSSRVYANDLELSRSAKDFWKRRGW